MYNYEEEKQKIFTEEGQRIFLNIRDRAHCLLKQAGAAMLSSIIADYTGDVWFALACVDRLVEINEIREIKYDCMAQHRVFISNK